MDGAKRDNQKAKAGVLVVLFCVGVAVFGSDGPKPIRATVKTGENANPTSGTLRIWTEPTDIQSDKAPRPVAGPGANPGPAMTLAGSGGCRSARPGAPRSSAVSLGHAAERPPASPPQVRFSGNYSLEVSSHYAGFASNYPHDDGPSYNVYNSANEKMPLWGLASGGPNPGVANSLWIGGDFDAEISTVPCSQSASCLIPPPVDGAYRGWRAQGYDTGPCHCPPAIQKAYFSANRGIAMFDLSFIPDKATLTSVSFEGKVAKQFGSGERLNLSQIETDRSAGLENAPGTGFKFTYDDASDGHLYVTSWNVAPYAVGNPASVSLGATGLSDAASSLDRNWFGVGLVSGAGETQPTSYYFGAFEGSGGSVPPKLLVNYRYVVPDAPSRLGGSYLEGSEFFAGCNPVLEWNIPGELDAHPLHFQLLLSDTGPVFLQENFKDYSGIDFGQTSYPGMVTTAVHDIYDESGNFLRTEPPSIHLSPLDVVYGGSVYPYGNGYNVGWRFSRPFVSHIASDTYTGGGYSVNGLGDAMMGRSYMEWSSDSAIAYPGTACATLLGYPSNITSVGGYISAGIVESFEVAVEYEEDPGNYYSVATVSNASSAFQVDFDPAIPAVTSIGIFFQNSNDGYAYLADLQVTDSKVYDISESQTVTSAVVASTSDVGIPIGHATLTAVDSIPSGTSAQYEMSNDNGSTWSVVTSGADFAFPGSGNQLRWRATLTTADRSVTPRIYSVAISNLLGSGQPLDSYAASGFEENATSQGVFQPIALAGSPSYSGRWWQSRYMPAGLPAGTYFWSVKAFALAGTGDPGPLSPTWRFTLDPSDSTPPPDMGNVLRAFRGGSTDVCLQWTAYTLDPSAHEHLYRSNLPTFDNFVKTDVFGPFYTDPAPPGALLFYEVLAADDCENESEN